MFHSLLNWHAYNRPPMIITAGPATTAMLLKTATAESEVYMAFAGW
jgi:hypothetical protein